MATQWLDDAFGPDRIRVTVAVEPAVDRLVRERDAWLVPRWGWLSSRLFPARWRPWNVLPGLVQKDMLHDSWAVMVEADSGQRVRLLRSTRDEAWLLATSIVESVRQRGVPALADLRRTEPD
jgi:hypothetical protein